MTQRNNKPANARPAFVSPTRTINRLPGQNFNTTSFSTTRPGLEWLIPQKRAIHQDVLALPLTRIQRSIYMLVDGRRTISDLARCTRKSVLEVEQLLTELQDMNLISI